VSDLHEGFVKRVRVLQERLRAEGYDAVLIGGLAVHLWRVDLAEDKFAEPDSLEGLAAAVRVTREHRLSATH
jgi:hypothetical protein